MPRARLYRTYTFNGQSPTIGELLELMKLSRASFKDIHNMSGVSVSGLYDWKSGRVSYPTEPTMRAVARAMGFDFKLVRSNELGDNRQELNEITEVRLNEQGKRHGKIQKKQKSRKSQ